MKLIVEKLKTGYTITDQWEVYAYSYPEQIWRKMRELFGIEPRKKPVKVATETVPDIATPISYSIQESESATPDATSSGLLIPEFEWDKSKEKHYQKIDFFEGDDGKVTIFYLNSRVFTTKEIILNIPYPVPYRYPALQIVSSNKRTAIRTYRKYLEEVKLRKNKTNELNKYLIKSTQDKIKETSERKTASIPFISMEKAMELKDNREEKKGDTR